MFTMSPICVIELEVNAETLEKKTISNPLLFGKKKYPEVTCWLWTKKDVLAG